MVLCVCSNKPGHLLLWPLLARTFNRMSHVQRTDGVIERVRACFHQPIICIHYRRVFTGNQLEVVQQPQKLKPRDNTLVAKLVRHLVGGLKARGSNPS